MVKMIEKTLPIEFISELSKREANSKKPIYQIHKWFARKTDAIFRSILLATELEEDKLGAFREIYYKNNNELLKGKVILDPFAGGGTTLVNGLRLGAKVIGVDINPMSWFIIKNELQMPLTDKPIERLQEEFNRIERAIGKEIKEAYVTTIYDKECGCSRQVDIMYVFWVKKCICPKCSKEIKMFPKYTLTKIKKKGYTNYHLCPNCGDIVRSNVEKPVCNTCNTTFDGIKGIYKGRNLTCPHCKEKFSIIKEVMEKLKKPLPMEMYAIEYYDRQKGKRGFKKPDKEDMERFDAYGEKVIKDNKYIPYETVPEGFNTKQIMNHNYMYWNQMFNWRQQYFLSMLLKEIRNIEDKVIRELFLCVFSNTLNANNMFCIYNAQCLKLEPLFGDHHMAPVVNPVENNLWGTKLGRGSFSKYFQSFLESKEFNNEPYERMFQKNKNINVMIKEEKFKAEFAESFEELIQGNKNTLLKCSSSEDLSYIPSNSVDAVVTDPPYYGAINYGEISEFFYCWNRKVLTDEYSFFKAEHLSKNSEVTVDEKIGIDKGEFVARLTRCLLEARRVLKQEGKLILTYNNSTPEGWATVLEAILKAGFCITGTFPVHTELRAGLIDSRRSKMNYDLVIVAKIKEKEVQERIDWEKFIAEVSKSFENMNDRLKYEELGALDIKLIEVGKAFEVYSKYYPQVYKDGKKLSVEDAIKELYR